MASIRWCARVSVCERARAQRCTTSTQRKGPSRWGNRCHSLSLSVRGLGYGREQSQVSLARPSQGISCTDALPEGDEGQPGSKERVFSKRVESSEHATEAGVELFEVVSRCCTCLNRDFAVARGRARRVSHGHSSTQDSESLSASSSAANCGDTRSPLSRVQPGTVWTNHHTLFFRTTLLPARDRSYGRRSFSSRPGSPPAPVRRRQRIRVRLGRTPAAAAAATASDQNHFSPVGPATVGRVVADQRGRDRHFEARRSHARSHPEPGNDQHW